MKNKSLFSMRATLTAVVLMLATAVFAQVTITGTVVEQANGEPIIGASILEVGTTNGTITDFDGNFTLNVGANASIQVSYIGFKTQTLTVGAQKHFNVQLAEDNEVLDEVVVVGYGVVKKNDATGSVTAIKPDDMNKGLRTNAQDMIQGKIAGVSVVAADGTPGGAGTITIRGGSSLNASTNPLIVIDGLAMDNNGIQGVSNPLSMVNPNDIESFTVLKDASATAIYGSRASNGVIIITTKKGSKGSKPKVSYNGNVSFGTLTNRLEVLTGDEIRAYATALGHNRTAMATLGTENTDWQDQIYRTAISTDHNVSVSGGLKNMPYRFSLGYTLQNGTIKTSQMQRVTASFSLSPSFLDNHLNFNINGKGMYIYNRYPASVVGAALSMDPTMPVRGGAQNIYGETLVSDDVVNDFFGGYYQRTKDATYGDPAWPYTKNAQTTGNPAGSLAQKNDRAHAGSFVGNVEADYQIHGFEDLRLHANFGADYSYGKQRTTESPYSYGSHYYGYDGISEKDKYNIQFSAYAQYYKDFNEDHHFDAMVGYESQYFTWKSHSDGAGTYQSTHSEFADKDYNRIIEDHTSDNALQSFYGRINWNGWNQLLVTVNFRADGSSRFARYNSKGENARWGLFPAVALGWKIKETFFRDTYWLNDLKLRLGYGITGQQDLGMDYYYLPTYTYSQDHAYYPIGADEFVVKDADGNPQGVYISSRPGAYNPDLTWEKTTTYNAGLDFAFLNNRITGNLDYYYRYTTDLLSYVDVSAGSNFRNQIWGNIGSLSNMGVEFAINGVLIDKKNFKWDLSFNTAWNDNKIVSLFSDAENFFVPTGGISSGTGNNVQAQMVGHAARSFYVYETNRYTVDGKEYFAVVDRNKDGQITSDDKYIYQSPDAKVTFGLQTKFQFYGFDLGISLRANVGNYVYNDVLASSLQWVEGSKVYQTQNGGYHSVLRNAYDTYYNKGMQSDGLKALLWDATTGAYSEAGIPGNKFSDWYLSDYFVENASFLRIDNITLGYTFDKTKFVTGRVYCTVSNPCVFSNYSGLDPEVSGGIDNNIYPRSMTTVVGVSLNF
ncbi:MAG: SusC/RagA family TonB-linked outer membrane protein [Paludibacteraceae bacterium]|nr:SusC/RagA family TonB-linked outer membrane protein [Paludibacteraceae bacterium]